MQRYLARVLRIAAIRYPLLAPLTQLDRQADRFWLFLAVAVVGVAVSTLAMGAMLTVSGWDALIYPDTTSANLGDVMMLLASLAVGLTVVGLPILAAAQFAYRRPPSSFMWPGRSFSWGLASAGAVTMVVSLVGVGGMVWLLGLSGETNTALSSPLAGPESLSLKLVYVGVAAFALLIAAAVEEVVFRGVLLQVMGAVMRQGWLICLLNGLLFAAIHFDPDPVAFVARMASGAAWAWAALRLGGLEFSLGAHWAGNMTLALATNATETLQVDRGMALASLWPNLAVSLIGLVVAEGLARRRSARANRR
jgi:membrane protease YdiL (CAAX protease family)